MRKATDDLRREHDTILHVMIIAERMLASEVKGDIEKFEFYKELTYFLRQFVDKCHHGKEEHYLFYEICRNGVVCEGGPIGQLLDEHDRGRAYIGLMDDSIRENGMKKFDANCRKYIDLMRSHTEKENNVVFFMADNLLDEEQQNEIFEKFEAYEQKVIGHGVHEELLSLIKKWEGSVL